MSVLPWPDHLLTMREWEALPEDTTRRYELVACLMSWSCQPSPPIVDLDPLTLRHS